MPAAHYNNIITSKDLDDAIFKNLFEVSFVFPTPLQNIHPNAPVLTLQNCVTAKLPEYPDLGVSKQRFKYSTRLFLQTPESTSIENLEFKFNLNQNINKQVYVFRMFKDWYDLGWNNEDGSLHYKRNMVGDIIVHVHDREGQVIRRVTYHNVQCKNIAGWTDLDWSSGEIIDFTAKFTVDYWQDLYY